MWNLAYTLRKWRWANTVESLELRFWLYLFFFLLFICKGRSKTFDIITELANTLSLKNFGWYYWKWLLHHKYLRKLEFVHASIIFSSLNFFFFFMRYSWKYFVLRSKILNFCACNLQVVGEHSRPLLGQVISISEPQGIATVHFDIPAGNGIPRTNDTLEVPLSRLQPPSNEVSCYGNKVKRKSSNQRIHFCVSAKWKALAWSSKRLNILKPLTLSFILVLNAPFFLVPVTFVYHGCLKWLFINFFFWSKCHILLHKKLETQRK